MEASLGSTRRFRALVAVVVLAGPSGAQAKEAPLDFAPFARDPRSSTELVPVLAGDEVLVTTTLRLFAFDAESGALEWSAGPPEGWQALGADERREYLDSVDTEKLWAAPAAGAGVAVAALQVPQCRTRDESWHGIQISRALPERRLFAFDLASGAPLWNHAPPPGGTGAELSFAQEMRVAGPPLVVGERVLVACTYDGSSIDYQVACYALATGELLWHTFVVRGQVERGFGEQLLVEFTAAPLVLDAKKGRVLAQTGVGTIAALDVASGVIAWRASYQAIPIPKKGSYQPSRRAPTWRSGPTILTGSVVLATPADSRDLLAFDRDDGHRLWSVPEASLRKLYESPTHLALDHLIGCDGEVLWFGGAEMAAFLVPEGLRAGPPLVSLWARPLGTDEPTFRGRVAGELLLVPAPGKTFTLDRASGVSREHAVPAGALGLLATDDVYYVLTRAGLQRIPR